MANRYWVGGSGNWDGTSTANWSATSGGPGGASNPGSGDSVFFDQAGTYTVSFVSGQVSSCLNLTVSAGTVTFAGPFAFTRLDIHGSITLAASTVWSASTPIELIGAASSRTITTNGVSFAPAGLTLSSAGSTWTLGSALKSGGIFVSAGTFSTSASNFSIIDTGGFVASAGTTVNLNGSSVGLISDLIFDPAATINAAASTINMSQSTIPQFSGGGKTYNNVSFTSTAMTRAQINGANTFTNLTIAGRASGGAAQISFNSNQTITGTFTVSAGTNATCRIRLASSDTNFISNGTARTLTCAAVSLTDVDFVDITAAGAAAPFSGTRIGNIYNNTNITFPAPKNVYWNLAGANDSTATGWAILSGGAPAANNFPLPQDTMVIDNSSAGTELRLVPLIVDTTSLVGLVYNNFDASARTTAFSVNVTPAGPAGTDLAIFGSWANGPGITILRTLGKDTVFRGTASRTFATNGAAFANGIRMNMSGSLSLQGNSTVSGNVIFTLTQGTLNLNGFNLSVPTFNTSNSNARTLAFNSGTITVTAGGGSIVWNSAITTGLTVTGAGTISFTSAGIKQIDGGSFNFGSVNLNQGGAGRLQIIGSNTFNDITNTYKTIGATTIRFEAGTTTTVSSFTAAGESGRLLTIDSTSAGSAATLSKAGGIVGVDFLSIRDSTATGGAGWYAGANSTNVSNNTGWIFSAAPQQATGNFLMFF